MKYTLCLLVGLAVLTANNHATAKTKSKVYIKLLEAYTTRASVNKQTSLPMTGTHFIVVWQGTQYPETFFWRGETGWLSCDMQKAHKGKKDKGYATEEITDIASIHKGDTLQLSPVTGGKFPIPAEIPAKAKNTLFFKTAGSKWLQFPVKKIPTK